MAERDTAAARKDRRRGLGSSVLICDAAELGCSNGKRDGGDYNCPCGADCGLFMILAGRVIELIGVGFVNL